MRSRTGGLGPNGQLAFEAGLYRLEEPVCLGWTDKRCVRCAGNRGLCSKEKLAGEFRIALDGALNV